MTSTVPVGDNSTSKILRVAAPLRQELLSHIRAAISSGEYPPGERLIERVLCEKYGVSRTVVREAVRHLEAEGLVTIVPNRGPVVTVLSREDAAGLFEVRAAMEGLAAERFAERATTEERAALEASCELIEAAYATDDIEAWIKAKDVYYDALLRGAHNDLIRSTVVGIHARVQVLRGLSLQRAGRLSRSLAEIRNITALAVAGRAAEAGAAAKAHVEQAERAAFEQMAQSGDAAEA
jgi:DNA-binding GntR family transcriptional regulator